MLKKKRPVLRLVGYNYLKTLAFQQCSDNVDCPLIISFKIKTRKNTVGTKCIQIWPLTKSRAEDSKNTAFKSRYELAQLPRLQLHSGATQNMELL